MKRYLGEITAKQLQEAYNYTEGKQSAVCVMFRAHMINCRLIGGRPMGLSSYKRSQSYALRAKAIWAANDYADTLARIILRIKAREDAMEAHNDN
jgi:hypothetical protein